MEKILKDKETATISDLPDEPVNYRIAVAKVRAFYEEIGHYINEHEEYEKLLLDIVGRSPVEIWKLLEPIVRNERKEHGESESHFFEELVKKIETKQPKLTHRKMPN